MSSNAASSVVTRSTESPNCQKPERLAEAPNEVWSWDITKLWGPVKWPCFVSLGHSRHLHAYFARVGRVVSWRVVGWRVGHAESALEFKALFQDAMAKHAVPPDQLTLHADHGTPMKAKATALMPTDPGEVKSHGRPHTSNDTMVPKAPCKTLKYPPEFPNRFQTIDEARTFCRRLAA